MGNRLFNSAEMVSFNPQQPTSYYGWYLSTHGGDNVSVHPFSSESQKRDFTASLKERLAASIDFDVDDGWWNDIAAYSCFWMWGEEEKARALGEDCLIEELQSSIGEARMVDLEEFLEEHDPAVWNRDDVGLGAREDESRSIVKLLLVAEVVVAGAAGDQASAEAARRLDDFREVVLPSERHGITLYRATTSDIAALERTAIDAPTDGVAAARGGRSSLAASIPVDMAESTRNGRGGDEDRGPRR